jgi:hypothetical protein
MLQRKFQTRIAARIQMWIDAPLCAQANGVCGPGLRATVSQPAGVP